MNFSSFLGSLSGVKLILITRLSLLNENCQHETCIGNLHQFIWSLVQFISNYINGWGI